MSNRDEVEKLFAAIMANCKHERKSKTKSTIRSLAKVLGKTENYLSAVESGRKMPSLKLFLKYLLENGFDVSSLTQLRIGVSGKDKKVQARAALADKIYSLDDDQVSFMAEQARIAENFPAKRKRRKP